jgi:hypothetical protein
MGILGKARKGPSIRGAKRVQLEQVLLTHIGRSPGGELSYKNIRYQERRGKCQEDAY